ncbi:MAG: hydrolase [Bacteroidetes bacterium]|nr:hydrolase [Bacteroidota bacterium]
MSSYPMRDQEKDHLLTPKNSAVIIIDYQPVQIGTIESMNRHQLITNITTVAKMAKNYKLPVILSTVNVKTGYNKPILPEIKEALPGNEPFDRTTINAWEDKDFREAVIATGRKKLIMNALWTEACLTFPALDALKEGFEVYAVVDAVGGTSKIAHEMALRRIEQAGARLISVGQLGCELQRDWNREDTAQFMVNAFEESGVFLRLE